MEDLINDALKNTSTGNWIIETEELETAGTNLDEFCDRLDNDYRVCEYELIDGGIDILFWLDYCPNAENDEEEEED